MLSLNCRGIAIERRLAFLEELIGGRSFAVACLQEVTSLATDIEFIMHEGYKFIIFPSTIGTRSLTFVIHKNFARDVSIGKYASRSASICIHNGSKRVTVISSHLPTGDAAIDNFEQHLDDLDSLLPVRAGHPVFIGVDANAVIGSDSMQEHESEQLIGPHRVGLRDAKGVAFIRWLHSRRLCVSSTFKLDESILDPITRVPDSCASHDFRASQIDYVISDFTTHTHRHTFTNIDEDFGYFVNSDHFLISCSFDFAVQVDHAHGSSFSSLCWQTPHRKCRWVTWTPEDLSNYKSQIRNACSALEDNSESVTLSSFTSTVVKVAEDTGSGRSRFHKAPRHASDDPRVEDILSRRRRATNRGEKSNLTKELWKVKTIIREERSRASHAELLNAKNRKGKSAPVLRKCS